MFTISQSIVTGLGFGLTSGVITTLGLLVGLHSGSQSELVVLEGILVIAVADAFSDALGIHISEESDKQRSQKEVWEATIFAFMSKFIVALTFIVPILFFDLSFAVVLDIIWGLFLIVASSFYIAKKKKEKASRIVLEHLFITILIVVISHFLGDWVSTFS